MLHLQQIFIYYMFVVMEETLLIFVDERDVLTENLANFPSVHFIVHFLFNSFC